MGDKDNTQRDFYDDNERFVDLYNGVLFHGKQIIRADELEAVDPNLVYRMDKKQTVVIPDKVKKWKGTYLAILTLENQTEIDYGMVIRAMKTEALNYHKQLQKKRIKNRREKNYSNAAEYLSGIQKGEKFIPVIVLVLYLGVDKKWDGATTLYDMLEMEDCLQPFVTNYKLNLFDYHEYDDYSIFKTENRELFEMLSCGRDEEKMNILIHQNKDRYSRLDADATQIINCTVGIDINTKREQTENGQEVVDMCKAWDDHWNSGKEIGKEIGKEEFLVNFIQKKLQKNMSLETIAEILEEDVDVIRPIYGRLKNQA